MDRDACNGFRYPGHGGHYESYFQRANHPSRPLAFWIRYTFFAPKARPDDAVGELWATWFDGERGAIAAVKEVLPFARCAFSKERLEVRIGDATLDGRGLVGSASSLGRTLQWSLAYESPEPPLLFLPEAYYDARFPKAKQLTASPLARFSGQVTVDGERHDLDGWVGAQSHNWGSKHTDAYAWAQVAGFDDGPATYLELITAKLRFGPLWTPPMTIAVVRHAGREYRWNGIAESFLHHGRYDFGECRVRARNRMGSLDVRIHAPSAHFVGLPYDNPPGGRKTCLNTKIAAAELHLVPKDGPMLRLHTRSRAAFEILTERHDHGVPVLGV